MPNKTEDELWRRTLACFEGHAHRPKTPENLQFALNRIAAKWLGKQPSFDRSNCRLHEEQLSPEQLCKLDRHHERASTVNEQEPVVVLLYEGRRLVLDGNTRVNKWCVEGGSRLRSVIFITPR